MKVTLELNRRELTLIRVACLLRMDALVVKGMSKDHASYVDTKAVLDTLWDANLELRRLEQAEKAGRDLCNSIKAIAEGQFDA